jgi:ribosomal protein S18 acetylase RimI-like enzyme
MTISIREYEPADLAALRACFIALQDAVRVYEPRLRPGAEIVDEYHAVVRKRCAEQAGAIFLADAQGEVVGYVTVLARVPYEELDDPPGEYAYVMDLYVHESLRGQGIGRALLARAEAHARSQGASELRIGALAGNVGARELYLGLGFAPQLEILSKAL